MVNVVSELPYAVREIRHCWIPLASGERLAARLWLPEMPGGARVPAIMEFSVYRKSDVQAVRDSAAYGYLAGHGYACVRVECRGTGDSDGLQTDQFATEYIDDALESLDWIGRQDWCTGKVALTGLSWPGHMCLQVAARNPPALGAILPMDAADDRYTNKYHGGCLLHYGFTISNALLGMNARPPHPEHVGEGWRAIWKDRVEHAVVCLERWIEHHTRDAYWAAGSVAERYADMKVPMYASCGLADPGYAVCTPRMLESYGGPRKLLLGPWAHRMPHMPIPGPGVDFLGGILGWLDHWLKGVPNGAESAPDVLAWIYDGSPPATQVSEFGGRWVAEPTWPPQGLRTLQYAVRIDGLGEAPGPGGQVEVCAPMTMGAEGGEWMPWFTAANGPELAGDQRADDAVSACFDTAPLEDAIDVFGTVRVALEVAADRPEAQVVVRLCSVAPDGTSKRLAFGFLDLSQREGDDRRLPVEPGTKYAITIDMLPASHHVPRGHRLRLAVSGSYWPMIWPARHHTRLTIHAGRGALSVPVRPVRAEDALLVPPAGPTVSRGIPNTLLRKPYARRSLNRDLASGLLTLRIEEDGGCTRIDDRDIEYGWTGWRSTAIAPDDPLSAVAEAEWTWTLKFGDIVTRSFARTRLSCTADTYEIEARVEAYEGEALVAEKTFRRSLPRPPA
jgi:putative CocE/NonD family hydrolase